MPEHVTCKVVVPVLPGSGSPPFAAVAAPRMCHSPDGPTQYSLLKGLMVQVFAF